MKRVWNPRRSAGRASLPGAAALLAGATGFVGLVLVHVAMGAPTTVLGMAVPAGVSLQSLESLGLTGEQSASPVESAAPLSPSRRVPLGASDAVGSHPEPVSSFDAGHRSASDWLGSYRELDDAELLAEADDLLVPGRDDQRQIGLLRALELRAPSVFAAPFLSATSLPDEAHRGLSVPAFAVARLAARAAAPEVFAALESFVFDLRPQASSRLRGQAVAALVGNTLPSGYVRLRDQLWRVTDPVVLDSAMGAACIASPELQLTLADLARPTSSPFPDPAAPN